MNGTSDTAAQDGKQAQVLIQEENDFYTLQVELLKNGMECRGSMIPKVKESLPKPDEIVQKLTESGVTSGFNDTQIRAMCRTAAKGKPATNFLLAEGTAPAAGPDGYLELLVKTNIEPPEYSEDEEGNIDFRTPNLFGNVEPGDEVGILRPPEKGSEGTTVTGTVLEALFGKPLQLAMGEGAHLEENGQKVVSDIEGRVIWDGKTISVSEELVIEGDVDLSVGNIEFNGVVEVKGDVLDDFDISAGKGIQVHGNVGICHLRSDGDVIISGMSGQGKGTVSCKGNLTTTYLNDVTVECEGDVIVKSEIRNARTYCFGVVSVPNGNIFGGETVALGGIEARKAGAVSGVKTRLTAGIDYHQIKLNQRTEELIEETVEVNHELVPLSNQLKQTGKLAKEEKKKVLELTSRMQEIEQAKADIKQALAEAKEKAQPHANPKINIKDSLGEGVILTLGRTTEEFKIERSGPMSLIENKDANGFHQLTLTPLTTKASELEREMEEKARKEAAD